MTATAPASSAIFACSALTTSMMTPPLSISAIPRFTRAVPMTPACVAVVGWLFSLVTSSLTDRVGVEDGRGGHKRQS